MQILKQNSQFSKILFQINKSKNLNLQLKFNFASFDPYYLLGVDRRADYKEIKKVYFKLASQYHPDRNDTPEAAKQFLIIKEAFEQIKQARGKAVQMDLEKKGSSMRKSKYKSVRPNADDYTDDFRDEQQEMNQDNYREFAFRAPEDEEYGDMKASLNTMHDINDIKLRSEDIDLPDPSKRFGLEEKQVKIKNFSDGSYMFLAVVGILFGVGFYFINNTHNRMVVDRYQNMVINMLNRNEFQEAVEEDKDLLQDLSVNLQSRKDYKTFEKKMEDDKQLSKRIQARQVPTIRNFVSTSSIQEDDDDEE